jgi:hypothetical protein
VCILYVLGIAVVPRNSSYLVLERPVKQPWRRERTVQVERESRGSLVFVQARPTQSPGLPGPGLPWCPPARVDVNSSYARKWSIPKPGRRNKIKKSWSSRLILIVIMITPAPSKQFFRLFYVIVWKLRRG